MITGVGVGEAAHNVLIKWSTSDDGQEWLQEKWVKLHREYTEINHILQSRHDDFRRFAYANTRPIVGRRTCGRRHQAVVHQLRRIDVDLETIYKERELIAKELDTVDDLVHIPLNWAHRLYLRDWYRVHELPLDYL